MGITEFLAKHITAFIASTGYGSVFLLMIMESMILPVPSEAVMPFAGFLIADNRFTFQGVIFFSTLGSLVGSLISYYIGLWGGKPLVEKYGKYILVSHEDLEKTEKFFQRRGDLTIFISRFIPVIRHLISLPAGLARMNLLKFCIYTVLGAGIWNSFLAIVGFYLKENWADIMKYNKGIDIAVLAVLGAAVAYFIYSHLKKGRKEEKK